MIRDIAMRIISHVPEHAIIREFKLDEKELRRLRYTASFKSAVAELQAAKEKTIEDMAVQVHERFHKEALKSFEMMVDIRDANAGGDWREQRLSKEICQYILEACGFSKIEQQISASLNLTLGPDDTSKLIAALKESQADPSIIQIDPTDVEDGKFDDKINPRLAGAVESAQTGVLDDPTANAPKPPE